MRRVSPEAFITSIVSRCFAMALLMVALIPGIRCFSQQVLEGTDLEKAAALLKAGDAQKACEAYELILSASTGNVAAQEGEVQCSEQLALKARTAGDLEGALRALLRAGELAPDSARIHYDLGVLEDQMRLYRDADASLQIAKRLDPQDPRIWYAAARVKMDLGQLDAAEREMDAYLKVHPDDASAHYGMGRVYQLGMQNDKARVEFERSIELKPLQTEAYYQLGDMALQQEDFEQAIANFDKTLIRNPQHAGALTGLGESFFKEKKYDKALDYLKRATAADTNYQTGHYYLGLTLSRLGRSEESRRELEIAKTLADAENQRASKHLQLNQPDRDIQPQHQ